MTAEGDAEECALFGEEEDLEELVPGNRRKEACCAELRDDVVIGGCLRQRRRRGTRVGAAPREGSPSDPAAPRELATASSRPWCAMILATRSIATLALGESTPRPSKARSGASVVSRFWKAAREPDETPAFKLEPKTTARS